MTPWIILSSDKKIILPVDCVMTIVEPIEGVKKMFLDKNESVKIEENLNEAKDIKCILVDVDNLLISEIEEVDAELGNPNCKLTNPVVFESLDKMKPLVEGSNDTEFMIRSEDILTIADPAPEVIAKYKELTS